MYTRHKAGKLENMMAADNRGGESQGSISQQLRRAAAAAWRRVGRQESKKDAWVKKGRPDQLSGTQTCAQF